MAWFRNFDRSNDQYHTRLESSYVLYFRCCCKLNINPLCNKSSPQSNMEIIQQPRPAFLCFGPDICFSHFNITFTRLQVYLTAIHDDISQTHDTPLYLTRTHVIGCKPLFQSPFLHSIRFDAVYVIITTEV